MTPFIRRGDSQLAHVIKGMVEDLEVLHVKLGKNKMAVDLLEIINGAKTAISTGYLILNVS